MLIPVIFLVALVAVVSLTIFSFMTDKDGKRFGFSASNLLFVYLYLILFVSTVIMAFGSASLLRASFALVAGHEFVARQFTTSFNEDRYSIPCAEEPSYYPINKEIPDDADTREERIAQCEEQREQERQRQEQEKQRYWKEQLIEGLSQTIIGALFIGAHFILWRKMKRKDEASLVLWRMYLLYHVLFFGIGALISFGTGSYQLLQYLIFAPTERGYGVAPGDPLAMALIFTPIWILFLQKFWKSVEK